MEGDAGDSLQEVNPRHRLPWGATGRHPSGWSRHWAKRARSP